MKNRACELIAFDSSHSLVKNGGLAFFVCMACIGLKSIAMAYDVSMIMGAFSFGLSDYCVIIRMTSQ